jgi:hypothetical protein
MEIEKALSYNSHSEAKYASLHTHKGLSIFRTRTEPYCVSNSGWDDTIALKDVKYIVLEGVLYIKGTVIFHYMLGRVLVPVKGLIWRINHEINDKLVVPLKGEEDIIIRKFLFFKKTIKGIDLNKADMKQFTPWLLSKEEHPYEIALSNFQLIEV